MIDDPRQLGQTVGGAFYPLDSVVAAFGTGFANRGTSQPKFDVRVDQELSHGTLTYAGGVAGTDGLIHSGIGPFDIQSGTYLGYGKLTYTRGALRMQFFTNVLNGQAPNLLLPDLATGRPLQLDFTTQTYDGEIRAALQGAFPALGVDAERAEAVAQPVVQPVGGRPDAERGRSHEAAPDRQPVADLRVEPGAVGDAAARHPRHGLLAPERRGPALRLAAPRRRHARRQAQRRRRRWVVAKRQRQAPLGEPVGLVQHQRSHPQVDGQPGRRVCDHEAAGAVAGEAPDRDARPLGRRD